MPRRLSGSKKLCANGRQKFPILYPDKFKISNGIFSFFPAILDVKNAINIIRIPTKRLSPVTVKSEI